MLDALIIWVLSILSFFFAAFDLDSYIDDLKHDRSPLSRVFRLGAALVIFANGFCLVLSWYTR